MVVALLLIVPTVAFAHDPPPISFQVLLTDEKLESFVMIQETVFEAWMTAEGHDCDGLGIDWLEENEPIIAEFIGRYGPVTIDQVAVLPVVTDFDYQDGFEINDFINYITLTVDYSVKAKPRTLTMDWFRFVDADGWPLDKVEMAFEYKKKLQAVAFTMSQPRFTWIAPKIEADEVDPLAYMHEPLPTTRLPLVSIGAVVLLGLALPVFLLLRVGARPYIVSGSIAILVGGLGSELAVLETVLPWNERPAPAPKAALHIFESLHRNIYRAFDYDTESEVYDVLAESVADELLDETYNEIFESLVLREDGNAVCRVRGVERLSGEATAITAESMSVDYEWRVTGAVTHWGHTHVRTNEYAARYALRSGDEQWRIHEVTIEDQRRIDDPQTGSY